MGLSHQFHEKFSELRREKELVAQYPHIYCFQIELEFTGNVVSCGERKTGEHDEKPSRKGREPTDKLNLHMPSTPGFDLNPGHTGGK